jgi:hypothetical protein
VTAKALEHCCLVARPPPAVLRPQSLAFLLPDSGQLYLTAVGQDVTDTAPVLPDPYGFIWTVVRKES